MKKGRSPRSRLTVEQSPTEAPTDAARAHFEEHGFAGCSRRAVSDTSVVAMRDAFDGVMEPLSAASKAPLDGKRAGDLAAAQWVS